AVPRRRGQNRVAVLGHQPVLDLALRLTGGDVPGDHPLDLLRRRRARLIERRPAHRAHHLAFELRLRRVTVARVRERNRKQRGNEHDREPAHETAIWRRYRGRSSSTTSSPTTLPLRATKKILGIGSPPHFASTFPLPSCTLGYVMPCSRCQRRASPE